VVRVETVVVVVVQTCVFGWWMRAKKIDGELVKGDENETNLKPLKKLKNS
jgi:hypothetical protein